MATFDPEQQTRLLLRADAARIERAAGFARTRALAVKRLLPTLPSGPARDGLAQRVKALEAAAQQAEAVVASAGLAAPTEAAARIAGFDYAGLLAAVQGLDAAAAEARRKGETAPLPAAPPTPKAAPQPPDSPLTGKLRAWAASLEEQTRPLLGTPAPPPPDQIQRERLDAALNLAQALLKYVTPRMKPVAVALDAYEENAAGMVAVTLARAKLTAEIQVDEPMRGWVAPLVRIFHERPPLRRPSRVAITQWRQARELTMEAKVARDVALDAPPERRAKLLGEIRGEKLRGAMLPLSNLHVTFAGMPHLEVLFPPRQAKPR